MGVRGLTSYIAQHAEQYLKPFELHDCNLVIDGDNLACNIYKDVTGTFSAFGGDYDDYHRAVMEFFHVLAECNIQPYVLMDGGYEVKKLKTVAQRLRGKIAVIKRINPSGSVPVFPVLMKEVFVDAVRDSGVPVMRCVFEADDELAALSRKLRCPVLSYDSDFYIHNARYIPLVTLTMKAHTKRLKTRTVNESLPLKGKLRKNEAKHFEKCTKANRIMGAIQMNSEGTQQFSRQVKTYKYLDCCMYRIQHLIKSRSLSKEKLPLFAALLGNDYIARSAFKNFFAAGFGKGGRRRNLTHQQRRIRLILQWLRHETLESALDKILMRLKKDQRESLLSQVEAAISGYSNEKCYSYEYFVENYPQALEDFSNLGVEDENSATDEETDSDTDTADEDDLLDQSESNDSILEDLEAQTLDSNNQCEDANTDRSGTAESHSEPEAQVDTNAEEVDNGLDEFPQWFLKKLYAAELPRFCVDLIHLKKYINSPQIEHFPHNDCNSIALPILIYNFTLLHAVPAELSVANTTVEPLEFTYLTRATRVTNINYFRFPKELTLPCDFDPSHPNPLLFRKIFEGKLFECSAERVFQNVSLLPEDLQLYFLCIVYWLQKSEHYDETHMYAILICLVVLRTVDAKLYPERDIKKFEKRYGKIVRKERLVRSQEAARGKKRDVKESLKSLSITERMTHVPLSDCLLVQDNLLKHFHMQEIFKKKYDTYSTSVLHAFSEFQSVVFQIQTLNALLNFPYVSPRMGCLYCGVFLYNLYDLLRLRTDVTYYVQHYVFGDSTMMFDFYCFLLNWCRDFLPKVKATMVPNGPIVSKKLLKKKRQAARKKDGDLAITTAANTVMLEQHDDEVEEEQFFDPNNKFCIFMKSNG